jgi:hypothetical protein
MRGDKKINFFSSTYANVTMDNFAPLAQCDLTRLPVLATDLVPVMEWAGDRLYNTGLLAHKDFVDEPNPALQTPPVFGDPSPVLNARPIPGFFEE